MISSSVRLAVHTNHCLSEGVRDDYLFPSKEFSLFDCLHYSTGILEMQGFFTMIYIFIFLHNIRYKLCIFHLFYQDILFYS